MERRINMIASKIIDKIKGGEYNSRFGEAYEDEKDVENQKIRYTKAVNKYLCKEIFNLHPMKQRRICKL